MNIEHVARVADLNARYAAAIDADRLEAWPDFFLDDGRYRITTAENVAQGLPLSIMYAASRAMLRDRVTELREANVYEGQRYRHMLGTPLITADQACEMRARTSVMVARVMSTRGTRRTAHRSRWSALPDLGRRPENGCRPADPDSDRQRRRGRRPEAAGHCGHRERRTLRGHRCVRDEKFSGAASGLF